MKLRQVQIQQIEDRGPRLVTPGGEQLFQFPRGMDFNNIIDIVEFAQKIEREAYDEGLKAGRDSMTAAAKQRVDQMRLTMEALQKHNAMQSEKIEQLLDGG